jgi:hypothetical protein
LKSAKERSILPYNGIQLQLQKLTDKSVVDSLTDVAFTCQTETERRLEKVER